MMRQVTALFCHVAAFLLFVAGFIAGTIGDQYAQGAYLMAFAAVVKLSAPQREEE